METIAKTEDQIKKPPTKPQPKNPCLLGVVFFVVVVCRGFWVFFCLVGYCCFGLFCLFVFILVSDNL